LREGPETEEPDLVIFAKSPHPVLSLFAIDMGEEKSYTQKAPQGVESARSSLKKCNWQSAVGN
jgi:hypothetical protein